MAFVKTTKVEKGDLIRVRRKKGYCHFGIASSDSTVIHFTGDNEDSVLNSKGVLVRETSLERFLRGDTLEVETPYNSEFPRDIVVLRARDYLGKDKVNGKTYNFITNNCEHFARLCYEDSLESKQVEVVADIPKKVIMNIGAVIETAGSAYRKVKKAVKNNISSKGAKEDVQE